MLKYLSFGKYVSQCDILDKLGTVLISSSCYLFKQHCFSWTSCSHTGDQGDPPRPSQSCRWRRCKPKSLGGAWRMLCETSVEVVRTFATEPVPCRNWK